MNSKTSRTFFQNRFAIAKKQGGFSTVELSLALLIVALIVVAAVVWYVDNLRKNSINANTNEMISAAATAKKIQTNQPIR